MTDTSLAGAARSAIFPRTSASDFTISHSDRNDWRPAPINPSWILSGRPVAQHIPIGIGEDGYSSVSLWRCTEGRFRWHFKWEESVYILSGEVEVSSSDGSITLLTAGSVALFQAGSTAIWNVTQPVQKMAVCRKALPARVANTLRLIKRPWSLPLVAFGIAATLASVDFVWA